MSCSFFSILIYDILYYTYYDMRKVYIDYGR